MAASLRYVCLILFIAAVDGAATFTFVNRCPTTVFPGILSNAGSPNLETTGFELPSGAGRALAAPPGWSGRFWARTGCAFDPTGRGSCATGDCGSGAVECSGAGATPPATLAEFTLATGGAQQARDFYDVSLVDGYNVPILIEAMASGCAAAGCVADVNSRCPPELRVGSGESAACRSACDAFDKPEYCCSGAYANPNTCKPTPYSQLFKDACPRSYSYAFDDPTSTFTCSAAAAYTVTFCPAAAPSQKSMTTTTTTTTTPPAGSSTSEPQPQPTSAAGQGVVLQNSNSWLAGLAYGDASSASHQRQAATVILGVGCWWLLQAVVLRL